MQISESVSWQIWCKIATSCEAQASTFPSSMSAIWASDTHWVVCTGGTSLRHAGAYGVLFFSSLTSIGFDPIFSDFLIFLQTGVISFSFKDQTYTVS